MDYFPLTIYTPKIKFWPDIDNALRAVAIEHKVHVRMLISCWNHSRPSEDYFLKSLADISNSFPKTSIEVVCRILFYKDVNLFIVGILASFHCTCHK